MWALVLVPSAWAQSWGGVPPASGMDDLSFDVRGNRGSHPNTGGIHRIVVMAVSHGVEGFPLSAPPDNSLLRRCTAQPYNHSQAPVPSSTYST